MPFAMVDYQGIEEVVRLNNTYQYQAFTYSA